MESCKCHSGWRQAGATDTLEFLKGTCSQYECTSDERCEQTTGVAGAVCLMEGWNCLCPFDYSLKSKLLGYDTYFDVGGEGTGGRCMGLLYWISVSGSAWCASALRRGWCALLILASLVLPFGQRRTACTHRSPSLLNFGLWMAGFQCRGDCVEQSLWHDSYALSLWTLEMCVWYHLCILCFWTTCMCVWCVAVWIIVIFILAAGAIAACVLGGECHCCEDGCCGYVDCDFCCPTPISRSNSANDMDFYTAGGDSDCRCRSGAHSCICCLTGFCHPLAYLFTLLPPFPQNLLGGKVGMCLGTHVTQRDIRYFAGPLTGLRWCLSLPWMQRDLHENEDWRRRVRDYLSNTDAWRRDAPYQSRMDVPPSSSRDPLLACQAVRGVPVVLSPPFTLAQGCVQSTLADYEAKVCWICVESRRIFDMYTCGHIFCSICSDKMLRKRMPCPLCRKAPLTVLRASE